MTLFRNKGRHDQIVENMAAFGLNVTPVPFHAALYVVNHGENMRKRLGRMAGKTSYIIINKIPRRHANIVFDIFKVDYRRQSSGL